MRSSPYRRCSIRVTFFGAELADVLLIGRKGENSGDCQETWGPAGGVASAGRASDEVSPCPGLSGATVVKVKAIR